MVLGQELQVTKVHSSFLLGLELRSSSQTELWKASSAMKC